MEQKRAYIRLQSFSQVQIVRINQPSRYMRHLLGKRNPIYTDKNLYETINFSTVRYAPTLFTRVAINPVDNIFVRDQSDCEFYPARHNSAGIQCVHFDPNKQEYPIYL